MTDAQSLRKSVEKALAFAHAAVDDPTTYRILEAKSYAEEVLPRLGRMKPAAFTLAEARRMVALVGQLRAVLSVLERRLAPDERRRPPN
jgi:hypothetical protein